jgi:hypothetical protein
MLMNQKLLLKKAVVKRLKKLLKEHQHHQPQKLMMPHVKIVSLHCYQEEEEPI